MKEINLNIIRGSLLLSKKDLTKLRNFIFDFESYSSWSTIDYNIFEKIARIELGINESNTELTKAYEERVNNDEDAIIINSYKTDKKYTIILKVIKKYAGILKKFLQNNIFLDFVCNLNGQRENKELIAFINYISENYNKKDYYMKVINKISEMGINEISYMPYSFSGIYNIVKTEDEISIIYSDGAKIWFNQIKPNYYPFKLENANYFIHRNAGKITMEIRNLDFDYKTLPTREELSHPNVNKIIDYKRVSIKTHIVDSIEKLNEAYKDLDSFLQSYSDLIKDLEDIKNKSEINQIKRKISEIMLVMQDIYDTRELIKQKSSNFMSDEELEKAILRKKLVK